MTTQICGHEAVFVRQSSAAHGRAGEQSSPASGADVNDMLLMKPGVFSSSLAYLQVLFHFFKDILTQ